ncbi:MAG: hypothetical protein CFE46_02260 [Burkholderiales bacterium PBB6]|nr:MAG: hypothetical protein CFE46_02260 [Burkholderiales bacterium PBB6]
MSVLRPAAPWRPALSLTDPYVRRARSLPAMPEVAARLLTSFDRDDLSLHEVASLIGRDQALSAQVLRMANSARYAHHAKVSSLNDAAQRLGLRALRDLTLTACVARAFPEVPGFDRMHFWRGTLAVAAYAQAMAPALKVQADTAYLGGLMLRTGQLLMMLEDAGACADVALHAMELDSRIGFEAVVLGCTHPEVTSELARHWGFPRGLVTAFGAAADPMVVRPFNELGAALRLASVVDECREAGDDVAQALRMTHPGVLAHMNLDVEALTAGLPDHQLACAGAETLMH